MVITWDITIPELTGDETRRAYVYLPEEAERKPRKRYPVLYMFDGHNVFFDDHATYGKSWGLADYLDANEVPLIVAAVECNHHPDGGRLCEYSPFTYDDYVFGHIDGRGFITMDWFVNEFKPYIDENFPTKPDRKHTYIAGSSMGGLMSLVAVTAYNEVFSRAAALSPSIWCAPDELDELFRTATIKRETVVYMDYGSKELRYRGMSRRFSHVASILLSRGIWLSTRIVPWGEHTEASWERQIPFFINTLLYER